jgi:hypothetical protein
VRNELESVVTILAIGVKKRNEVRVGGERLKL